MGNRANVIFTNKDESRISPCIYLHWNGGPESIFAFLAEMERRGIRADQTYEAARFCQIVGEFFDSGMEPFRGLSLGIVNGPSAITPEEIGKLCTDSGDNGFYVVTRNPDVPRRVTKVRRFLGWKEIKEVPEKEAQEEWTQARDDVAGQDKERSIHHLFLKITSGKTFEAS